MENKIKLREQDVARYYWLDDVTFIVEFKTIPQLLWDDYECNSDEECLLYGEYWKKYDCCSYILSWEHDYHIVNGYIDEETDLVIRNLIALGVDE